LWSGVLLPSGEVGVEAVVGVGPATADAGRAERFAGAGEVLEAGQAGSGEAFAAACAVGQVTVAASDAQVLVDLEQQRKTCRAATLVLAGVAEGGQ
jgi:hypothetical protein